GRSMPCCLQYSISSSRDCIVQRSVIRHGAMILMSGASALMPSSKRIWSFPFPVAPWQIATAPSLRAISTSFFAMAGRAMDVPSRYAFSYTAPAFTHGIMKSSANSSTMFSIYNLEAPESLALSSSPSSSSPCPQSMQQQITSYPNVSFSHGMIAVVSSPPEYAKTTFSLLISDSLLNVFLLILPPGGRPAAYLCFYRFCGLHHTIHQ